MKAKNPFKKSVYGKNASLKAIVGIAMATIMLACLTAMVPIGGAQAGIEGQKGINIFMMLSYITLGLALLIATMAFAYLLIKRSKKEGVREEVKEEIMERSREEEIMETIKELKELKRRIEDRGEGLTSASDVFLAQVLILSEVKGVNRGIESINKMIGAMNKGIEGVSKGIDEIKSWLLFELGILVAFCLAIISILFAIS